MSQDTTMLDRANPGESVAPVRSDRAEFRKMVRRLSNALVNSLARLAPAAAGFALRWQPDVTFRKAVAARRRTLNQLLYARSGGVVDGGPFQGMKLSDAATWGDGDLAAKLLGCYEQELHAEIEAVVRTGYHKVIVVGCAEGYYAVGLGRRMPNAQVIAFETVLDGQKICRANSELNGLADRVRVEGTCTERTLNDAVGNGESVFLLVDCEGAERQLLDPNGIPGLVACDFIVECHDFLDRGITDALIGRFSRTHCLDKLSEGARDANSHPLLGGLRGIDRSLAVCEFRPETMHWLVARHRV